jgi:hypothetical protein
MLGTDHPIPWEEHAIDHVLATTTLTDKQQKVAFWAAMRRACPE